MSGRLILACIEASGGDPGCNNESEQTVVTVLIVASVVAAVLASLYWRWRIRRTPPVPPADSSAPSPAIGEVVERTFSFRVGRLARDAFCANIRHYCERLGLGCVVEERRGVLTTNILVRVRGGKNDLDKFGKWSKHAVGISSPGRGP
jgi:hypothetical protein